MKDVYYGQLKTLLEGKTIKAVVDYTPANFIIYLTDGTKIEISGIEEFGAPSLEILYEKEKHDN